jgi:hypothetical protein
MKKISSSLMLILPWLTLISCNQFFVSNNNDDNEIYSTEMNGIVEFYSKNRVLYSKESFINSVYFGKSIYYNKKGGVEYVETYFNNQLSTISCYNEEGFLFLYKGFDCDRNQNFCIHYKSKNEPIKYSGHAINFLKNKDRYALNKKFRLTLFAANPPNSKTLLTTSYYNNTGRKIKKRIYIPDDFNRVVLKDQQSTKKDLNILFALNIFDTIHHKQIRDSLFIKIKKDGTYLSKERNVYRELQALRKVK